MLFSSPFENNSACLCATITKATCDSAIVSYPRTVQYCNGTTCVSIERNNVC